MGPSPGRQGYATVQRSLGRRHKNPCLQCWDADPQLIEEQAPAHLPLHPRRCSCMLPQVVRTGMSSTFLTIQDLVSTALRRSLVVTFLRPPAERTSALLMSNVQEVCINMGSAAETLSASEEGCELPLFQSEQEQRITNFQTFPAPLPSRTHGGSQGTSPTEKH